MRRILFHPIVVVSCVVACAAVAASAIVWPAGYVRTEDHNGDGRPDVWRTYDHDHRLLEVAVDTNFDGRSDVHEYYEREALVRRESDRDFNDQVDLVEEFDPGTRAHVRSVVDVDRDGAADLLVLFQDGQAVFSSWVAGARPALAAPLTSRAPLGVSRAGQDRLVPLEDPFRSETAVGAIVVISSPRQWIGLSSSGGLPTPRLDFVALPAPAGFSSPSGPVRPIRAADSPRSPRGPPVAS